MINKEMTIGEVVSKYPQTIPVFQSHGMGCLGCSVAKFEIIVQGAAAHGIDIDKLIQDLNDAVK
jgi:hybrid cluster-associated redox disulfide protein